MKLNKPPVSKEHTLLEEYVDFLLTDLSNVTPISVQKKNSNEDSDIRTAKSAAQLKSIELEELEQEKLKQERLEQERLEQERLEQERLEQERLEQERLEQERLEQERLEQERLEQERLEREKLQRERLEREKLEQEMFEQEKLEQEKLEQERLEQEKLEQERLEQEKFEQERLEQEKFEQERLEKEKLEKEKLEQEKLEQERLEREKLEKSNKRLGDDNSNTEPDDNFDKTHILHADNDFSLDAEEEEAKKWDVVLTQEIEKSLLNKKVDTSDEEIAKPIQTASSLPVEAKPHFETDERLANVEKLLARISLATKPQVQVESKIFGLDSQQKEAVQVVEQESQISTAAAEATFIQREAQRLKDILPEVFQTLIFQVGKMPLSVPLLKLGGIVKISEEDITPLVGTPDWFIGLAPHDRGNLMVVDTQKYLMPERTTNEKNHYEYLIMLDDSNWALACNSVGDAKNLTCDDIRWSERSSKRPWFAGMVVDYMSALIEVDELINMLADTIVD